MADAALKIVIGAETQAAVAGLKQVETAAANAGQSIKQIGGQFQFTNDQVAKGTGQLARFKTGVSEATTQTNNLAKSQKELAYEAAKASNAFVQSGSSLGAIGEGATKAYSAIRRLAYILPGIGIAGIFNLAFEAISKMVSATEELNEVLQKLKSNKDIISEAVGGQAGDIARVQALASAVRDSNLTYAERKRALDLLKETNKAYFGDLTLETATTALLAKRVTEYANALIQAAVVKGFTDEISKTTIEFNKQNDELSILKQKLDDARAAQEKFKNVSGISTGAVTAVNVQAANDRFEEQRKIVEKLKETIASYTGKIEEAVNAELKIPLLKDLPTPKAKIEKEVKERPEIKFIPVIDTSNLQTDIKTAQGKLDKFRYIHLVIAGIDQDSFAEAQKEFKKFADAVNKILTDGISTGIGSLAESIGNALGTGGNIIASAGNAILGILGDVLEQLGKAMIAFGIAQAIAIESLKSLNPYVAIAAGALAVVAGAALKSVATKPHKFAEGGIVTGPTNALIGEAGPEVIFPLEKLNKFIKNGLGGGRSQNVNVTGRISGNDLQLVLARNTKNQSYV